MDITRKEYEKNYADRLSAHKNDYEDKSEKSFLEIELNSYNKYYNSLKKISHFIKTSPKNNLGHYPITSEVGWELEIINEQVYNEIITKKKAIPEEDEFKRLLYSGDSAASIEINIDNLNNRILSAKSILEFINDKKSGIPKYGTPEKQKVDVKTETNIDDKEEPKDTDVNDYTKSTIEDYLADIKNDIRPDQYEILVDALYLYFKDGKFPKLKNKIMFKSVNKKKVGWALKEAYMNLKTDSLRIEYLQFAKDNINLFEKEQIESENFKKSNFYKYFTTDPAK